MAQPAADSTPAPRERARLWARRLFLGGLILLTVAAAVQATLYVREVESQYHATRASAEAVQERLANLDTNSTAALDDLPHLHADLVSLQTDLTRLDNQLDIPVLSPLARHLPVAGPRIRAAQDFVDMGVELTAIAVDGASLLTEVHTAFRASGLTVDQPVDDGPTWLDVVAANRDRINELEQRFDQVLADRAALDTEHLPARVKAQLDTIDGMLADAAALRDEYAGLIPLLEPALGADGEVRYLVLLQNSAELRPTGGFIGTYALVTFSHGRLTGYEIANIREFDNAYIANREEPLRSPGPIYYYLEQREWLPHDANWPVEFAESADVIHGMYQQTGWPPIQGIIGLNYSAVQQVLDIIGPYEVEIQGETRIVRSDTIIDLIESYRDLSWQDLGQHKEVVQTIGASLIERLKATDLETKVDIILTLSGSADRREIQAAMFDPALQAEVVRRGWDGALNPDPQMPTMAVTISSIAGGKASTRIFTTTDLAFRSTEPNAPQQATLTITLEHRGDPEGHHTYEGFHRTWLAAYLPEGARVLNTSRPSESAARTGEPGVIGFNIGMPPQSTRSVAIEFELLDPVENLRVRRQSGANDIHYRVSGPTEGCTLDWSFTLTRDHIIDLSTCAVRPEG